MTESEIRKRLSMELLELFQFSKPSSLRKSLQNVIMEFIAEQDAGMVDKATIQNFQYLINFLDLADKLCNTTFDEFNVIKRRIENT